MLIIIIFLGGTVYMLNPSVCFYYITTVCIIQPIMGHFCPIPFSKQRSTAIYIRCFLLCFLIFYLFSTGFSDFEIFLVGDWLLRLRQNHFYCIKGNDFASACFMLATDSFCLLRKLIYRQSASLSGFQLEELHISS